MPIPCLLVCFCVSALLYSNTNAATAAHSKFGVSGGSWGSLFASQSPVFPRMSQVHPDLSAESGTSHCCICFLLLFSQLYKPPAESADLIEEGSLVNTRIPRWLSRGTRSSCSGVAAALPRVAVSPAWCRDIGVTSSHLPELVPFRPTSLAGCS